MLNNIMESISDKISDFISKFGGSWYFILTALFCIIIWILLNTLTFFDVIAFDKYPFIFLNLFLSLVAAFQAPFILMSHRKVEIKQDDAYRRLFAEIKELVESDLALEKEIMESNKKLAKDIAQLRRDINREE